MSGNFGMVCQTGQVPCQETDPGGRDMSGKLKTRKNSGSALAFGGSSFLALFSLLTGNESQTSKGTAGDPSSSVSGRSPFSLGDSSGEDGKTDDGKEITAGKSRWPGTVEQETAVEIVPFRKMGGGRGARKAVSSEPDVSVQNDSIAAAVQLPASDEEGGNPFQGLTVKGTAGEKALNSFTLDSGDAKASGRPAAAGREGEKGGWMGGQGLSLKETGGGRTVNPFSMDSEVLSKGGHTPAGGEETKDGSVSPKVFQQVSERAGLSEEVDTMLSAHPGEDDSQDLPGSLKRHFAGAETAARDNQNSVKPVATQAGLTMEAPLTSEEGKGPSSRRSFGVSWDDQPQEKRALSMEGNFSQVGKKASSGDAGSGRTVDPTGTAEDSQPEGPDPAGADSKKGPAVLARENGIGAVKLHPSEAIKENEGIDPARRIRFQGALQEGSAVKVDIPSGLAPGKQDVPSALPVNGQEMAARILEMRQTLGKNSGRVTLSLEPPSLGTLTMDVRVRDRLVETIIRADSFETHQALKIGLEDLRSALNGQGFKADNLQILWQGAPSAGDDGGSSHSFFRENGGSDQRSAFGGSGELSDPAAEPEAAFSLGESRPEGISIFA